MVNLEIPQALRQSVECDSDYGGQRQAWLDSLPDVVAGLARRWSLTLGRPFQPGGCTSWVAPARNAAGRLVVVKVCWCHRDGEELHEAEGLAAWNGNGTVRLLD